MKRIDGNLILKMWKYLSKILNFQRDNLLMQIILDSSAVDYINILRQRGYRLLDAIITGAKNRLRPILMTSLTTIFGMIPLAAGRGTGGEIWQAFGIPAIGGFLTSWLISLILVPVIYLIFNQGKK